MGPGRHRRAQLVAIAALIAASVATAAADPAAEALFQDGRALLKAGKIEAACERFQRSADLEAKVGTLLNLADCREREGKLAAAWEGFVAARALAVRLGDARADEAGRRAAAVRARLAHLTIMVPPPHRVDGLAVTRDGVEVPPAAWDVKVPVAPGDYTIAARAPGLLPWSETVTVEADTHVSVMVPLLAVDPAALAVVTDPDAIGRLAPMPLGHAVIPLGRFALGVGLGISRDTDLIVGVRAIGAAPLPLGTVRATVALQYANIESEHFYAPSLGFDYVIAWAGGQIASGAGIGFGMDIVVDSYRDTFYQLRASPLIFRIAAPALELGVHLQWYPKTGEFDRDAFVGLVAADWFLK